VIDWIVSVGNEGHEQRWWRSMPKHCWTWL